MTKDSKYKPSATIHPVSKTQASGSPSTGWYENYFIFLNGSDSGTDTHLKYSGLFILCGILLLILFQGCGSAPKNEPFTLDEKPALLQVGDSFTYEHTGPLPWGNGQIPVSGQRTISVTAIDPANKNRWIIKDDFEQTDVDQFNVVDRDFRLHRQEMQFEDGTLRVEFNPPMPLRFSEIPEGGQGTYTVSQRLIDASTRKEVGTATIKISTTREQDERIITPAGAYMCRHFISRIEIQSSNILDEKNYATATEESYWCDKIGWFVKLNYRFDPLVQNQKVVRPAYNTETVLTEFDAKYGSGESTEVVYLP
ncbi:MAG: hypothetical protein ACOX5R_01555 [bacterium]